MSCEFMNYGTQNSDKLLTNFLILQVANLMPPMAHLLMLKSISYLNDQ